jgi:hypothetical protein
MLYYYFSLVVILVFPFRFAKNSVPDPDPPDVFGPPGSGPISQRYGYGSSSGSGSFYHQEKIVRKTLIPTVFVTSFGLFIFEK